MVFYKYISLLCILTFLPLLYNNYFTNMEKKHALLYKKISLQASHNLWLRASRNKSFPSVRLAVFVLSSEINCGSSLIAVAQIVSVPLLKLPINVCHILYNCSKYISWVWSFFKRRWKGFFGVYSFWNTYQCCFAYHIGKSKCSMLKHTWISHVCLRKTGSRPRNLYLLMWLSCSCKSICIYLRVK